MESASISRAPFRTGALAAAVDRVVAQNPDLQAAHWGLVVADERGETLYAHDADRLFTPASCLKLITGAAARTALGSDARFATRIATDGSVDAAGTLHGNLYLVGGGDPSLATADLQAAARAMNLHRIEGNVVVDDSNFDSSHLGRGWAWDDLPSYYSAEVDALTLDENVAGLRIGAGGVAVEPDAGYLSVRDRVTPGARTDVAVDRALGENVVTVSGTVAPGQDARAAVTVHDPALYAGAVLKWALRRQGIAVTGGVTRGKAASGARTLWEKSSAGLMDLERHMLKESDNLYGETLFRALAGGSSSAAPARERELLGLSEPARIVDGCGLSHDDRVSPRTLDNMIEAHYSDPVARGCLPVAGVDGTLQHRMPDLAGRVQAKTGTLEGVSTLAGWLTLKDGRPVSFAWMCDAYPGAIGGVKRTEDALLTAVDGALSGSGA